MSSSFRKAGTGALILLSVSCGPAALAQETFFIPRIVTSAEWDSNPEMIADSNLSSTSTSYKVDIGARFGRITPRSDTEVRPRVVAQQFPDRSGVDPVSGYLDLLTVYHTLKGQYRLLGRFSRVDTFTAEYGQAAFDNLDPQTPVVADTGIVLVGKTRTAIQVQPTFRYDYTERIALEGGLQFDKVSYSSNVLGSYVGYKSSRADLSLNRQLAERTELGFGPYVARFEADDGTNRTDSYGATIDVGHAWSETSDARIALSVERSDITQFQPARVEQSTNNWGLEIYGQRRNRVGSVRYRIGRFLEPSSFGSRRTVDQIQVQYNRPLSARTYFDGAVRLWRDRSLGGVTGNNRDRALAELTLNRALARNWLVSLGYRFARFDDTVSNVASNHGALIQLTYVGGESKEVRQQSKEMRR